MLKFNNTHIFTGYLKQLLADFSLPRARVFKESLPILPSTEVYKNIYIKDDKYQIYKDNEWQTIDWHDSNFYYDKLDPNFTTALEIDNNIYDSYTHEYLGDYLRFKRDYLGVDLMPLYNCFSNRSYSKLNKTVARDILKQYKFYEVPIKLFNNYTIAIDNNTITEVFCGITDEFVYEEPTESSTGINATLYKATKQKINTLIFNQPILYNKLTAENILTYFNTDTLAKLGVSELDLKLYIKLPAANKSTITILEGNYLNWNDFIFNNIADKKAGGTEDQSNKLILNQNHFVVNTENFKSFDTAVFKPITSLQLLKLNTKESYPMADRLTEYLLGNVITSEDTLADNVKRVQEVVSKAKLLTDKSGLWDNKLKVILYDKINKDAVDTYILPNSDSSPNKANHDILGYVDKDVESLYKIRYTKNGESKIDSISSVDIYNNFYEFEEK